MERIEPEVASIKSVRDDGSETSIFLKPSAIFCKRSFKIPIQRKYFAYFNQFHGSLATFHV